MERVYGPYANRDKYRITIIGGTGREAPRRNLVYATIEEAQAALRELRAAAEIKTIEQAIEDFLEYRQRCGTQPQTIVTARFRLVGLFKPVLTGPVNKLRPERAVELYKRYQVGRAPDTHQGALSLAKAMFNWARKEKLVQANPWDDVDPVGRKRRRKNQLRIDEARKLTTYLVERADDNDGALGVLIALVLGLRAHEVVGIEARDLDDGGKVLHIAKSKTRAGERPVVLPELLRAPLEKRVHRKGKLLPYRPGWVRDNTKAACLAAGVPVVCAQALRGSNATFALEAGTAPEVVARSLGHTSPAMTRAAYALQGSGRSTTVGRIAALIAPGKESGSCLPPGEVPSP
jgi:integrase